MGDGAAFVAVTIIALCAELFQRLPSAEAPVRCGRAQQSTRPTLQQTRGGKLRVGLAIIDCSWPPLVEVAEHQPTDQISFFLHPEAF